MSKQAAEIAFWRSNAANLIWQLRSAAEAADADGRAERAADLRENWLGPQLRALRLALAGKVDLAEDGPPLSLAEALQEIALAEAYLAEAS